MTNAYSCSTIDNTIRQAFPVLDRAIYLNVGTYGIMPKTALDKYVEMLTEFEACGAASRVNIGGKSEETRKQVAALIGADSIDDVAFNRNATDGINFLLGGMEFKEGDEVITTREEHEAMYHPLLYLQQKRGIKVHWLDVSPDADQMIAALKQVYNKQTKLVAMSMVSCETGKRIPAKEICAWAKEHNIISLMDGAQATGNIPVNVKDIGCDFYASNGHKWLLGPKGTGFFYGKTDKMRDLFLPYVGAGSLEKAVIDSGEAVPWGNARKFEYGTRSWSLHAGLGASMEWLEFIGWNNIYQHNQDLSNCLKEKILNRSSLQLLSPVDWKDSSALVSFVIKGHNAGDVSRILSQKKQIVTRVIPHFNALRISTALFNNESDLDTMMEVLDGLD